MNSKPDKLEENAAPPPKWAFYNSVWKGVLLYVVMLLSAAFIGFTVWLSDVVEIKKNPENIYGLLLIYALLVLTFTLFGFFASIFLSVRNKSPRAFLGYTLAGLLSLLAAMIVCR